MSKGAMTVTETPTETWADFQRMGCKVVMDGDRFVAIHPVLGVMCETDVASVRRRTARIQLERNLILFALAHRQEFQKFIASENSEELCVA
jgi:hypothetical protein